jgi:hypothetical protein
MTLQAVLAAIQDIKSLLSMAETDELCTVALSRAKTSEHAIRMMLVEFAFALLDNASQTQKNDFVDHLVDYMKQPHANRRQIGAEYYQKSKQLVDQNTRRVDMRSLISKLESDGANFNQETRILLDVIMEEQTILGPDEARLYDLIRSGGTAAKDDESRLIALDYMKHLAAKGILPRELEASLYDAARSTKETVSKKALDVLKTIRVRKIPDDIRRELDKIDVASPSGVAEGTNPQT